jgi:hypothetical protein
VGVNAHDGFLVRRAASFVVDLNLHLATRAGERLHHRGMPGRPRPRLPPRGGGGSSSSSVSIHPGRFKKTGFKSNLYRYNAEAAAKAAEMDEAAATSDAKATASSMEAAQQRVDEPRLQHAHTACTSFVRTLALGDVLMKVPTFLLLPLFGRGISVRPINNLPTSPPGGTTKAA